MDALNHDRTRSIGRNWNEVYGGYFSSNEPLEQFFVLLEKVIPSKKNLSVAELGSANANLCKFVGESLVKKGYKVDVTVVGKHEESVFLAPQGIAVNLTVGDLKDWNPDRIFDVILMRSVLHYNSFADQLKILKNIRRLMCPGSLFINQLASGNERTISLFATVNQYVFGRQIFLQEAGEYQQVADAVFKETKLLGYCPSMKVSALNLLDRFSKTKEAQVEDWNKMKSVSGWVDKSDHVFIEYPVFVHTV